MRFVRATALATFGGISPAWAATEPPVFGTAAVVTTGLLIATIVVAGVLLRQARRRARQADAALAALDSQHARLQAALLTPADGCLLWDPAGRLQLARLPAQSDEVEPASLDDLAGLLKPEDAETATAAISALGHDGTPFDMELAGRDDDRHWRLHGAPLPADCGGHAVWLQDVSAQQRRLQLAEQRETTARGQLTDLQRLLDAVPIPLYERGNDLAVIWCNDAYAHLVGLPKSAVPGADAAEIETALNRNAGRNMARTAFDSGEPCSEIRHFVVDGARRALHVVEVPGLRDGHLAGLVRDVTDMEEKELDLRRHMEAHDEVLSSLSTSISIYGPDKRLSYFNPAYAELWHLDGDWLGSRPLHTEVLDELREHRRLPEVPDFPAYKRERLKLFTDLLETREDITDSLALERSFNTLIAVQRETLDNLYEGVVVFGSDGRLKLFNPAYIRIWHLEDARLDDEPREHRWPDGKA